MFVATVVSPVIGETEVVEAEEGLVEDGLVSDGEPLPVAVALFELPAVAVGAGVAAAMPA